MQCPFVSPKRLERALQNARIAELERDKALEISASLAVVSSKSSLHPIVVVRNDCRPQAIRQLGVGREFQRRSKGAGRRLTTPRALAASHGRIPCLTPHAV